MDIRDVFRQLNGYKIITIYIKLPMYSSNMRSATNSSSSLSRQSFLSSDFELVKKKQVNFPAGCPNIGSKRVPVNFEKPTGNSQNEYNGSISMHENVRNLTATELRVEDYYHLRTATASSEIYKIANSLCSSSCLNRMMLNNNIKEPTINFQIQSQPLPQPNTNPLSLSGVSTSKVFHTPAERLGSLFTRNLSGQEINNSIRSLQENSFNCNLNVNVHQPIVQPNYGTHNNSHQPNLQLSSTSQASFNRVNRAIDSLDIFLQFFYKELKASYDKKDNNISSLVAEHLTQMLKTKEGSEEYKEQFLREVKMPTQTSSEQANQIIKKYGECKEMCKLITDFTKYIDAKKLRNQLDTHQQQYCRDVLKIIQDVYTNYTREIYRYCHNIIPEESMTVIRKTLDNQYNTVVNQYSQKIQASFPHQVAQHFVETSTQGDTALPLFSERPYVDYHTLNQEKMKNHLYVLNYVKSCFEGLQEQEERERQQHFGHVITVQEDLGEIDDFVSSRKRKEREEEFIIILEANPEVKKQSILAHSLLDKFQAKQLATAFSSMKINQFSAEGIKYNKLFSLVHFSIYAFWTKGSKKDNQPFKHFHGSFRISQREEEESIKDYLSQYIKVHYNHIIRRDAAFTFGALLRKEKFRKVFSIDLEILQQKINFPSSYKVEMRMADNSKKCVQVNGLTISNQFGSIAWKTKINIESLDFTAGTFEIGDNTVLCDFSCLNKPCLVTFFTFPKPFISWMERQSKPTCEKKLKKHIERSEYCRLVSIDWEKQHYSIEFERFFEPNEQTMAESPKKDDDSLRLEELQERFGIHNLEMIVQQAGKQGM